MVQNDTRDRPRRSQEEEGRKGFARGEKPSFGLPGKIQEAQSTAPEGAGALEILKVAQVAFDRGVPAGEVWEELGR